MYSFVSLQAAQNMVLENKKIFWYVGQIGGMTLESRFFVQTQRTDSERRQQRRNVNQRFLSTLTEMGISTEEAEIALTETGNVGVEVGLKLWIQ